MFSGSVCDWDWILQAEANFYLGGSAYVAPSALGCPPKTQLLSGGQTAKALRCNASQASKAKIDAI